MSNLAEKIYSLTKKIPKGKITTYKIIADFLNIKSYRAVGQILKKNPYSDVPCHRVVKSNGEIGGFRGQEKGKKVLDKKRILENEGISFIGDKIKDFEKVLWKPKI